MGVLRKFSLFRKSKGTAVEVVDLSKDEDSDTLPSKNFMPKQEDEELEDLSPATRAPRQSPQSTRQSTPPPPPLQAPSPGASALRRHGAGLPTKAASAASVLSPTAEDDDEIEFVDERPAAAAAAPAATAAAAAPKPACTVTFQVPEASPAQSLLPNFEVPLEQVHASVGEAFGPTVAASLQSSKWDKRVQALKAISAVLKGQDIEGMAKPGSTGVLGKGLNKGDRGRGWKVAVQLLHHFMKDKVMPVRLAAYELFSDVFTSVVGIPKTDVHGALQTLVDRLLCGLGDSNCRVHEGARKNVLLAAEGYNLLGLSAVLAKLRAKTAEQQVVHGKTSMSGGRITTASKGTNDRAKTIFGVLDCVNLLLQHFPGRRAGEEQEDDEEDADEDSWTQKCIAPFIIAGLDDSLGLRVRGSALDLAVTAYQTLGGDAMEPLLAKLRPAKQQLLKQRFKESEEDDGEESIEIVDGQWGSIPEGQPQEGGAFADLVICGTAVKPLPIGQRSYVAPLPGCLCEEDEEEHEVDEEYLMDGILEETGAAFSSTGMMMQEFTQAQQAMRAGLMDGFDEYMVVEGEEEEEEDAGEPQVGIGRVPSSLQHELQALEQDHWMLETELVNMGVNIDEQEALLNSLQSQDSSFGRGVKNQDDEVAVLLSSLQGDLSARSMHAVEVC